MNKYKVGDKVVLTVSDVNEKAYYSYYVFNDNDLILWEPSTDKYAEPLTTYTEPLEDKIRRQAAEITRLLAENERLKAENKKMGVKLDAYELYGDQHEEEYNQAFNQGAETAWELARKIVLKNGYSAYDLHEIFNCCGSHQALEEYTYPEAAAKVEEWEKAKEEIKVGDVVSHEEKYGVVISEGTICFRGFTDDATPFEWYKERCTKTGRHIDIDGFLKQIGGGDDEK